MTLAQSFIVIVDGSGGPNWAILAVSLAEIAIGLALALTPYWVGRGWVKLSSSTERSHDRHVLLFTVAGLMAIGSGVTVLLGKVSAGDSLIPLLMVGAAAAIALLPERSDAKDNDE
jgi:hypothetical protein